MKQIVQIGMILIALLAHNSCSYFMDVEKKEYYPNGNLKAIGNETAGKREGVWAFYDPYKTQVDSITFRNGIKQGLYKNYDLRQDHLIASGHYDNGKKHGIWQSYHDGGAIHGKEEYKKGVPIGQYAFYYADGKPKIITQIDNGKWHGEHLEYYPNGAIQIQGRYHNGGTDGQWKEYYQNGLTKEIYHCQAGLWHGAYKKYYPNGNIAEKGAYERDRKIGVWQYFDAGGILVGERKHK